ncbi:hypothetical protein EI94DRAFT_1811016 [Lactarius quietus]|nr:hypothetical protein EI94DRAFT_1811016 [Lactarius quietus]
MAPSLWKAPWRRAKNTGILSDNSGVDVGSGSHDNSQGEYAGSNSSWDYIVSSTSTTQSVLSLNSDYDYTSTPILSPPLTSTLPPSTTDTGYPSAFVNDDTSAKRLTPALSFPSPYLHFASKLVSSSLGPASGSSPLPSSFPTTLKTEPPAHSDVVLPLPPNPEGHSHTRTSPNNISSPTLSSKIITPIITSSVVKGTGGVFISDDATHLDVVLPSPPNPEKDSLTRTSSNDIPSSGLSSKSKTRCTTSVTNSSVLKSTGSLLISNDGPSVTQFSPFPSDTPQRNDKSKPRPSRPGSSVPLPLDALTSSPLEVDRIAISTSSSSSPFSATVIPSATIAVPFTSLTSVHGVHTTHFSDLNQVAAVDHVPSTSKFSTPTASSRDVTSSFTTTTAIVTFSPTQISGSSTSVPVTATVQTVLPTVLPASSVTGKRSVPVAAIVAPVTAAVTLILLLVGLVFRRRQKRAHRVSLPAFVFSRRTEPPMLFKEVTVLPPIPADPARASLEPPRSTRLLDVLPSLVLPPAPTLDPFADPPEVVSTSLEGDGLSRLSSGSVYDESIARASMTSSHVRSRLRSPFIRTV